MEKISVIIPSYNRFKYLLNALESVYNQTYKNIEVIIIDDNSDDLEYYTYGFPSNTSIIHLEKNSREVLGYPCPAYVRNIGIKKATGKYIAFLDDDDIWFPTKLEKQMEFMSRYKCKMSCSDGYIGNGIYNPDKTYKLYNKEYYYKQIKKTHNLKKSNYLNCGFQLMFTHHFISIYNCIILSSVIVEKSLLVHVNYMPLLNYNEDYHCWLKILLLTDCLYVDEPLIYYDNRHGDGILWKI